MPPYEYRVTCSTSDIDNRCGVEVRSEVLDYFLWHSKKKQKKQTKTRMKEKYDIQRRTIVLCANWPFKILTLLINAASSTLIAYLSSAYLQVFI